MDKKIAVLGTGANGSCVAADLTNARTESQLKAMLDELLRQLPIEGEAQAQAKSKKKGRKRFLLLVLVVALTALLRRTTSLAPGLR